MKKQSFFIRWCDHHWLYANYLFGILMFGVLLWNWEMWDSPQKLICLLAIAIPIHNFEEYMYPGGFYFMNNIVGGSKDPLLYPQNKLTTTITNTGAEIVLMIYTAIAPTFAVPVVIVAMVFGFLETLVHIIEGTVMWFRYRGIGKQSIYAPGLFTSVIVLMGISILSLKWLTIQQVTTADILMGVAFLLVILIGLLMIPLGVSSKLRLEQFRLEGLGYFEQYEHQLEQLPK